MEDVGNDDGQHEGYLLEQTARLFLVLPEWNLSLAKQSPLSRASEVRIFDRPASLSKLQPNCPFTSRPQRLSDTALVSPLGFRPKMGKRQNSAPNFIRSD
jgi:hypothetical protein